MINNKSPSLLFSSHNPGGNHYFHFLVYVPEMFYLHGSIQVWYTREYTREYTL